MKVEIPELKRCCCCMPLRRGLIAWGYIKLVILLLLIAVLTEDIYYMVRSMESLLFVHVMEFIFVLMLVADFCLCIVFIIGGHRKSPKLLHIYYIFNIVILIVYTVLLTLITALEITCFVQFAKESPHRHNYADLIPYMQGRLIFGIFILGIQTYVILLIRSEVNKLRNNNKYRFSNLAAQAEDTLENGTNNQENNDINEAITKGNGIDNQFEGIINQIKESDQTDFTYKKF